MQTAEPVNASTVARLRLITERQYFNTLAHLFGEDMRVEVRFAPIKRTDGLSALGTASAGVTVGGVELFQRTAAIVANRALDPAHRALAVPCKPAKKTQADDACAGQFLTAVARILYRRPLDQGRLATRVHEASEAAERLKDFYAGLTVALEGMLLDPSVLFIADRVTEKASGTETSTLDGYSVATRLSLFLWNALPDETLIKAAESGELLTPKGRARVVDMMLASPRLEEGVRALFDDMLVLQDLDNLAKDAMVYPGFTEPAVGDAREQTLRTIVDHLITKRRDYRDLFTTHSSFMSPALALIYQVPTTPEWRYTEFSADSPRVGLLTQIAFLAAHAHPARSSVTRRGKALRELLLCQRVPDPPANVDFSIVEDPKATFRTARERVGAHLQNPVCAGCHKITDPIGLALENFDGAGQYRDTERGAPIDASGSLDGRTFKDVTGLAQAVHDHPALPKCLVRRTYAYAVGGPLSADDGAMLEFLDKKFEEGKYRLPDLMKSIALSGAFLRVANRAPAASARSLTSSLDQSVITN